jgi:cytoskeletal protein CcmA (bactofilin family)
MAVGDKMKVDGNLNFHRLLRIDGFVKGKLVAPKEV